MLIKKKIWPEFFEAVKSGKKNFELRLNDFDITEGTILLLEEWNPEKKEYTGRTIEKKVGYVSKLKVRDLENLPFYPKGDIEKYGLQIISLC